MAPYSPILPYEVLAERLGRAVDDIVKLDANENPYGPAPSVARALAAAPFLHIYPDPESTALRQAIASYTSVAPEYILVGAGADELIDLLFRLFIAPGNNSVVANGNGGGINGQTAQQKEQLLQQQSIVNCPPTFGMYRFDADVNGAVVHDVYRRADDFSIDIDAIEALFARLTADGLPPPKMVFVTSPNNPDGSVVSDAVLTRLLRLPTLVVLDEAYFEFSRENRITWVPHVSNLVVLRTFSKWAGLAGMRIGYGAFPLNIIKHLWKIKQPYNVSVAAQIAAIASIEEKHDLLAKVEALVIQRERFYERIKNVSWLTPFPSSSNYVLCRVHGGRSAVEVKEQLAKRGILIRYYTSTGLADCIRISMGTDEQMERVYKALAEL